MEQLKHILFIDIETVPIVPEFSLLSEGMQEQWTRKAKFLKSNNDVIAELDELFEEKAGIFSEFAKVVSIAIGCLVKIDNEWKFLLKSITEDDEKKLLDLYCKAISKFSDKFSNLQFCGHNIKEFDIPFLCRRMVINEIALPEVMQLQGKKPWEINHIDTLELWKFGDHKHFTSLALLAEVFGIPSPKNDIDGSMVSEVYWKEHNLARISKYCMQDVYTTAKVYFRLIGITQKMPEAIYLND